MPNVNDEWVRAQMDAYKVRKAPGEAVLALLETWSTLDLDSETSEKAVEIFSKLALTHALVQDESGEEIWVQAQPGAIIVGDTVRVRHDAYTGDTGTIHNGRVGRVVGVRYGDIIFRSEDNKTPFLDGTHYTPYILEKRIK
jgi:hypothetical protein